MIVDKKKRYKVEQIVRPDEYGEMFFEPKQPYKNKIRRNKKRYKENNNI